MTRYRGAWGLLVGLLMVLLLGGCSRPADVLAGERTPGQAPFHDPSAGSDGGDLADVSAPKESDKTSRPSLPFEDLQHLPAGTLLSVRLESPLSLDQSESSGSFEAALVESVLLDGNVLIPQGAQAIGRIESARTSKMKPGRGYLRLALESVHTNSGDLSVQTASLFVRQSSSASASSPSGKSEAAFHLEKGHRLVFRLTQPIYPANQNHK